MFKKLAALIILLMFSISVASLMGCGRNKTENTGPEPSTIDETQPQEVVPEGTTPQPSAETTPTIPQTSPQPSPTAPPPSTTNNQQSIFTEDQRMQIFYELVEYQDSIPTSDPDWGQKQEDAYQIFADKYGTNKEVMRQIAVEGVQKDWPMPEPPDY